MKLSFADRILISVLYPIKGSIDTLRLVKDVRKKIDFSPEDCIKYGIDASEVGKVSWNKDVDPTSVFDIDLTESEICFLKDRVDTMDRERSIPFSLLDLCEKIKQEDVKKSSVEPPSPEVEVVG